MSETRSSFSTFSADLMGVAHFLADRRLRTDWPELGGVGVDWTELVLVLVEPVFATSDMTSHLEEVNGTTLFQNLWAIATIYRQFDNLTK